jgi:hypothetical protein
MSTQAFSGFRDVSINFALADEATATVAAPLNFYKAVNQFVQDMEGAYAKNSTAVADLTDVDTLITGPIIQEVHKVTVSVDISEGEYTFLYLGTFPNAEAANA